MKTQTDSFNFPAIIALATAISGVLLRNIITILFDFASKNSNLKLIIFLKVYNQLGIDMFAGLRDGTEITNYIGNKSIFVIYAIYKAAKSNNLIANFNEPVLSRMAYNGKKSFSNSFFVKCQQNILEDFSLGFIHYDVNSQEMSKFNLLVECFELYCEYYIKGDEPLLFIHCAGAIFGATYVDPVYKELVEIAVDMTIENEQLRIDDEAKLQLFINIVSKLIFSEVEQGLFVSSVNNQVKECDDKSDNSIITDLDKILIVRDNLLKAIQSSSPNK